MMFETIFTTPMLATVPGDKEIYSEYIGSKHPDGQQKDELEALPEVMEKQSMVFYRDEKGNPAMMDYQIKGFFKEACLAMIHSGSFTKEELKNIGYGLRIWFYWNNGCKDVPKLHSDNG